MRIYFCFLIRAFFEVGYKPLQGYLVSLMPKKPFDLDSFDERFLFLLWYHTRRMCNENQNSIFNVNMIHPICVWGAHKFEHARFRHGIKKNNPKTNTIPTFVCCELLLLCSNSDNPGCRFPETPRHNWVYCGRDPPICYTPPHLSICFIIVVILFFSVLLFLPPFSCFQVKDVDTIPNAKSSGIWLAPAELALYTCPCWNLFFRILGLPLLFSSSSFDAFSFILLFFFSVQILGRAHNTFIYSFIITHANSAGFCDEQERLPIQEKKILRWKKK